MFFIQLFCNYTVTSLCFPVINQSNFSIYLQWGKVFDVDTGLWNFAPSSPSQETVDVNRYSEKYIYDVRKRWSTGLTELVFVPDIGSNKCDCEVSILSDVLSIHVFITGSVLIFLYRLVGLPLKMKTVLLYFHTIAIYLQTEVCENVKFTVGLVYSTIVQSDGMVRVIRYFNCHMLPVLGMS